MQKYRNYVNRLYKKQKKLQKDRNYVNRLYKRQKKVVEVQKL